MSTPPNIASLDIDVSKFSLENLQNMRERFPGRPDEELARFLIGKNNDLETAADQLQKRIEWEKTYIPTTKESCGKEFPLGKLYQRGFDRDGRPVLVWAVRNNIVAERDMAQLTNVLIWWMEYTIRKVMPENRSKYTIIMDRSDFKRENADTDFMKNIASTLQVAYPERLHRVIIYPVDFFFYTLWNICRWFLDPNTSNKVHAVLTFAGVEEFVEPKWIPRSMGGEDDYVFNSDDFPDFWEPEDLTKIVDLAISSETAGSTAETEDQS